VDTYEKVFEFGGSPITDQPARSQHVCYQTDDGFVVVDVWDDAESFAAFGEIIGPATAAAGLDARPLVHPVVGTISQAGVRGR
jgi:hypothetical protein